MFGSRRRGKDERDGLEATGRVVSVALIGEGYRRSYVKNLLDGWARVAAELASERRARLLPEIGPEVVVLDCASEGTNPLLALPNLSGLEGSPRIVALTDDSVSRGLDAGALLSLGADATADIRDSRLVVDAVLATRTRPPRRRTRAAA